MTEKKWFLQTKKADFYGLAEKFEVSPITIRCMVNRGVDSEKSIGEFLNGTLGDLADPFLMKDVDRAVEILMENRGVRIGISTDYDCDGIFSGWMLKIGLDKLGFATRLYTPNRVSEGYGLNNRIVDDALRDECKILITCDNGIAAIDEVKYAKENGMIVIVTDHHEPQEVLPEADAVIDPKQEGCRYPFKGLCGAGVVHRFFDALFMKTGNDGLVSKNVDAKPVEEDELELITFAAIATIADVMELVGENRIIVKRGLLTLEKTKNVGLRALLKALNLWGNKIRGFNIGFMIGPCFNAAGRIDDVQRSFELLACSDDETATSCAQQLRSINEERKDITVKSTEKAMAEIKAEKLYMDDVIMVVLPDCHESIVGIVAGRIKEAYNHPTIVFTEVEDECIKGSGRSVEAYNMFEELMECKDLMVKFGGHKMAAGMTLKKADFEQLRQRLNANSKLEEKDFVERVDIDIALPFRAISKGLIEELEIMEPFGVANPKPLFAGKNFNILSARRVGKEQNILSMSLRDSDGVVMDAICFDNVDYLEEKIIAKWGEAEMENVYAGRNNATDISFAFYPSINEYRGNVKLQIVIRDFYIG